MYDAETIWYNRLNGVSLTEWPSRGVKCTGVESVRLLIDALSDLTRLTTGLDGSRLTSKCRFLSMDGKEFEMNVYDILQHCFNHSTFHRGQLVTMLRFCGAEKLPSTDYITYIRKFG